MISLAFITLPFSGKGVDVFDDHLGLYRDVRKHVFHVRHCACRGLCFHHFADHL